MDKDCEFNHRINIEGEVKLVLRDGITLRCNNGIHVPAGSILHIYGQIKQTGGLLCRISESNDAGIGGNEKGSCGTIIIHSGNVNSVGGDNAAGIGGGQYGDGGNITILNGKVDATGGSGSAGGIVCCPMNMTCFPTVIPLFLHLNMKEPELFAG